MLDANIRDEAPQFLKDIIVTYATQGRTREYYESGGKREGAKRLKDLTLEPMPFRRKANDLLRNNHGIPSHPRREKDEKMRGRKAVACPERFPEGRAGKPIFPRKHRNQAANLARPVRRRFWSIALPEAVFERARNPCVVARFFFFG